MKDVLLFGLSVFAIGFTLTAGSFVCYLSLRFLFPKNNPNADHLLAMQERNILLELQNEIHRESVQVGRLSVENTRKSLNIMNKGRDVASLTPSEESSVPTKTIEVEVEVCENRRRYLTISVSPEMGAKILNWTYKPNPTREEEQAAIEAVKASKVISEKIMSDDYELGSVDFEPSEGKENSQ